MSKIYVVRAAIFTFLAALFLFGSGMQAKAQGFKRTMLQTIVYPDGKYVTALYTIDIEAGAAIPKHTHPGIETSYVLDGEIDLAVDGQDVKHYKAGDSFQIPAGIAHSAAPAAKPVKLVITYVVEKDKPLATIVQPK